MRHHPSACRLAQLFIKSHFGEFCQLICKSLIEKGPQTLRELVVGATFSHLQDAAPREQRHQTDKIVRTALQILLQHSCVVSYLVQPSSTRKNKNPEAYHLYTVDIAAISRRIRAPHYLQLISRWYSSQEDPCAAAIHEAIVSVLLENGRLTVDQIVTAVLDKQRLQAEDESSVKQAFETLVLDRFVEQAAPANLPLPGPAVFAKLTGRRAAAPKPNSEAKFKEDEETARQQPALEYRDTRFKLPADFDIADGKRKAEPIMGAPPAKKQKKIKGNAAKPKKQDVAQKAVTEVKAEAVSGNAAHLGPLELGPEALLWQISQMTFTRRFRYDACIRYLQDRNKERGKEGEKPGELAGVLAAAILRIAKPSLSVEPRLERTSPAATEHQIKAMLPACQRPEQEIELPEDLSSALQDFVDKNPMLVQSSETGGFPSYYLNLSRIIEEAKMGELRSIIKRRFGLDGLIVWNCLLEHKMMESKTISERVLMPSQQTVSTLYKLLRGGFVAIQDVPRTADHAPSKTIYTWKIDLEGIWEQVAANLMKAICNLADRVDAELTKRPRLLNAMHRGDKVAITSLASEAQKVKSIGDQLECHSLSLIPILALFSDF